LKLREQADQLEEAREKTREEKQREREFRAEQAAPLSPLAASPLDLPPERQ
jgi:hypothetical protein